MRSFRVALIVGLLAGAAAPAVAGSPAAQAAAGRDAAQMRNRMNLRVGMSTADENRRPAICLEVRAWSRLSVEGCGTGSGFLHRDEGAELAHFRSKWSVVRADVPGGRIRAQAAVGFAELQLTADEPGFHFGSPRPQAIETAGPEAGIALQWLGPLRGGVEWIASASMGLAWLPHAPKLVEPQSTWQPSASLEFGVGW